MPAERVIPLEIGVRNRDNGRHRPHSLLPLVEESVPSYPLRRDRFDLLSKVEPYGQTEAIAAAIETIHLNIDRVPISSAAPFTAEHLKAAVNTYIFHACCPDYYSSESHQATFGWPMQTFTHESVIMLTDILDGKDDVCVPEYISDFEMEVLADVLSVVSQHTFQLAWGNHEPFNQEVVQVLIHNHRIGRLPETMSWNGRDGDALEQDQVDVATLEAIDDFFRRFQRTSNIFYRAGPIGQLLENVRERVEPNDYSLIREAIHEYVQNKHGISVETATYFLWLTADCNFYHDLSLDEIDRLLDASEVIHTSLEDMDSLQQNHRFIKFILNPYINHLRRLHREVPKSVPVVTEPITVRDREDLIVERTCAISEKMVACQNLKKRFQQESKPASIQMFFSYADGQLGLRQLVDFVGEDDSHQGDNGNGRGPKRYRTVREF